MSKPKLTTAAQIENNFTYHPPTKMQGLLYQALRADGKFLAEHIHALCPDSREKSLAITKLEEAIMWANAAIARNPQYGAVEVTIHGMGKSETISIDPCAMANEIAIRACIALDIDMRDQITLMVNGVPAQADDTPLGEVAANDVGNINLEIIATGTGV